MMAVKEKEDLYFSQFAVLQERLAGKEPAWLQTVRKLAIERFGELGFPTTRNEEWRFTNVAPIARTEFQPPKGRVPPGYARFDESHEATFAECIPLIFVNGRYLSELASRNGVPAAVRVRSLRDVLESEPGALEPYLGRYASYESNAFVALNTALAEDGAFIEVAKDTVLKKPVYVMFISAALPGQPSSPVYQPRNLVVLGRGSQATIIENYLSVGENQYFTNAVTEAVIGENARLDYTKVQQEGDTAFHIATAHFHQARSSSVTTHTISLGSMLDREDTRTVLDGEGAESLLHGLYVINGKQHVDNHTVIDHAKPHCASREVYKGVLDGAAGGVFNGKIIVRKDAQKTDSKQSNKNLLLSESATINTKPQLEIYADDVKCTHGATIGQIDQEAVFYLRSRGIGLADARALLIQAFANDILDRIRFEPLRKRLKVALLERLTRKQEIGARGQESERISALVEEA